MAKELSSIAKEKLNECKVVGKTIVIPTDPMDRNVYVEIKKSLEGIGGKWKTGTGFVFPHDPQELFNELVGGKSINLKKDFQFFETPPRIAAMLVKLAEIGDNTLVCEPSAGKGAIIDAILKEKPNLPIIAYELMKQNSDFLKEKYLKVGIAVQEINFLDTGLLFQRFIANPPFTKGQDVDHVMHMYKLLTDGGRLVSVMSTSWQTSSFKKNIQFRDFLKNHKAVIMPIGQGEFKESGTMVPTCIVVVNKPY